MKSIFSSALVALGLLATPFSHGQVPNISATQSDAFTPNGAGRATPGSGVNYTIQINNTGAGNATGTKIDNPTPTNMTLVPTSIRTTCLAINDVYSCLGNVPITIAAGSGVLANDTDPDNLGGGTLSATAIAAGATTQGGTVTLSTNGGFVYTPPAGFTGADSFTYTLNDNDDTASTDTATVTINVSGMIWFIDENQTSNGNGRLDSPFNNLASFQAINNNTGRNPRIGHAIFLYESADSYAGGITLLEGQRLIGQDAGSDLATLAGVTPPTGSAALPVMNSVNGTIVQVVNAAGDGVTLGLNSRIHGFTAGSASQTAIIGSNAGTVHVSGVAINTTGNGLVLNTVTLAPGSSFTSITSTGGTTGVSLTSVTGNASLGSGALSGHSSNTFAVSGGGNDVTYSGPISKTSGAGSAVTISSKTGGTVILSGAINSSAGAGVALSGNGGATINLTGGVVVSSGANAAFAATGGGTVNVTGSSNTLTSTTGTALNVSNTDIGASGLNFRTISSNGAGSGIVLNNTGTAGGLTLSGDGGGSSNGSGGVIQNSTGVGVSLTSTRNVSLNYLNISGSGDDGIFGNGVTGFTMNRCNVTNNGNALNEDGVDFGGTGLVTPNASLAGTATITNSQFSGNYYNQFSVRKDSGTAGITLTSCAVSGRVAENNNNDGLFFEVLGTATITANVQSSTFSANKGDHFQAAGSNSGNLNVTFKSNTLTGGHSSPLGQGITINAATGVAFGGYTGTVNYDIDGNTINGAIVTAIVVNLGTSNPPALFNGFIRNNQIGTLGSTESGSTQGHGIAFDAHGKGTHTCAVTGNIVRETFDRGMAVLVNDGSPVVNLTVTGNTLIPTANNALGSREAIEFNLGGTSTNVFSEIDAPTVRVNLASNTLTGGAFKNGDIRMRQRFRTRVEMPSFNNGGDPFNTVPVVTFHQTNNPGATATVTANNDAGVTTDGYHSGSPSLPGPIPQPLWFAPVAAGSAPESVRESGLDAAVVPEKVSSPVTIAAGDRTDSSLASLTQARLDSLVAAARGRWIATGLSDAQKAALNDLVFEVVDLPGWYLGEAVGTRIRIDKDAGGNGWFIDETPEDDSEFEVRGQRSEIGDQTSDVAANRVDLMTAVMHEMGHSLGLCDTYDPLRRSHLMYGFLTAGERRAPRRGEAEGAVPHTHDRPHYLGGELVIGTLPAGKSITITYQATVNTSPTTFTSVSSQGTVSGSNFANVLTNDPATPAAGDATVTPVEQRPTLTNVNVNGTEDVQLNFTAANFTASFNDVNGDSLNRIRITSLPANGTLRVNSTAVNVNDEVLAASLANLNFVPGPNFNGNTSFTYNASDGQDYAVTGATVNIAIASVNDEPTLTAIPNPTAILEDAAEQTVNLSGISEGPANESAQTLTITAVSDNIGLIPNPVAVDYTEGNSTGAVRYTPVANAFGTATITVTVQDSGGVAPGDDTITRQFTVVVNPVADTPSITNATTLPNTQTTSGLVVSRNAADGAEVTHYQITNIQNGSLFQNDGTTAISANSFITHAEASAGLKFTPALNFQGDATFQLQASTSNVVGGLGGNVVTATISVNEQVTLDTPNAGDNDAAEGGLNNGIFTFTRGGSAGTLVANFALDPSSTASAADFNLSGGSVTYDGGTGTGTVTFPNGQTTVQVTLTALPESLNAAEAAETVRFNLVPVALPAPGAYQAGTPNNATVTIAQNGFLVTTTNDSGAGSLRQAVANANALPGTDTITFSDGTDGTVNFTDAVQDTITLTSGELTLTSDIVVSGTSANRVAVASNGTSRVFQVNPGTTVRLVGLTITGGGVVQRGAGVMNRGTLLVLGCAITNNTASGANSGGGGLSSGDLGESGAVTTVVNSTFSGNSAGLGGGANTRSGNSLTLINCTFSGNTATPNSGGAVYVGGATTILNSTLSGNFTSFRGGAIATDGATVTLANSIVAGNTAGIGQSDIGRASTGPVISNGGNLIGNGQDTLNAVTWLGTDLTGTTAAPLDPLLGSLANNGGPTQTHALLSGSPALNAGSNALLPADTYDLDGDTNTAEPIPFDQRGAGFLRAIGTVDIGAFELQKSVSLTALDAAKAEGNGGATTNFTFTVARTGDLADSVTLDWTVTGSGVNQTTAADFAATTGQVTLNATEGSKVVNVVVNADNIVEPAEGFTVTLSNPTNGYVLNGATADGTINNDDSATILLTGGTAKDEGNSGTTTYTFTATLSQPVQGGVSVAYTTNDGTATVADNDYTDNDSSLNFPGSVANEQRTFDVFVTGDDKVEANEEFTAALGAVTGGHGAVTVGGTSQTGTITNDDSASISITDVTQLESGGGMNFTVSLTAPSDLPVTLDFATANNTAVAPGDYTSTSGTVTFPATSITAQSIPVTISNDGEFEADETFFVNLTNLSAGGRNVSLADGQGQGTIQNDDALTISITATDDSADENTAATGTWRVSRNGTLGAVTANLEVDLTSTAKPADWTQTGASFVSTVAGGVGTVTIPDGQSFVDITLTPVADLAAEADETVQLNVTAGIGYTPSNSPTRTVTIARNDFAVTNTDDSGEGSLRQAVDNGNVLGGNPTITFEGPVFTDATADTITLGGTQIPISVAMTLEGPGADLLAVSGGGLSRIFSVDGNPGVVTLRGVSLVAGRAVGAGDDGAGAAISFRFGNRLVIEGCRIADNISDSWAGAINKYDGDLEIRDCTFSGNVANSPGTGGGAIFNQFGDLVIVNSTFSGNSAPNATPGNGGGGAIHSRGSLVLSHSTVTGNRVGAGADGGGIDVWGNETITHSIIAGNFVGTGTTPSDIGTFGNQIETSTHNLVGDAGTSGGITDGTGGNLVGNAGTGTRDIATVLDTTLADNGGLTPTHKLVVGSPAIDAGSTSFNANAFTPALANDQRGAGFTRVRKGLASSPAARIDIGAYELIEAPVFTNDDLEIETGSTALDLATASGVTPSGGTFSGKGVSGGFFDPTGLALGAYTVTYTVGDANGTNSTNLTVTVIERPSLTVTSTSDTVSKIDGQTSLREALAYAATLTGAQTVAFSNTSAGGAVNFHDAAPDTITLGGTELEIIGNVTVDGPGADLLTVDANGNSRVFTLPGNDPAIDITLRGVRVVNGDGFRGGGLRVSNGILRVEACVFEDNVAAAEGGAISSDAVTLTLTDSTFLNNEADEGGAIEVQGDGFCRRGHFEGNQSAEDGGAIDFGGGTFTIADSLFTGNDADDEGGAIENNGNDLILLNCTLSGNSAGTTGGGINNQGGLTVVNSTIAGNRADADGVEQNPGTPDEGFGGGGIRTDDSRGLLLLHNTIVAGNRRGAPGSDVAADLSTALPADIGVDAASSNNLIGDPGFVGELVHGVNGNIIGKEDSGGPRIEWPLAEILNPVLALNGGETFTHALVIGSPALDAGVNALAVDESSVPLATDQRGAGFDRIVKGLGTSATAIVDIGAYELFAAPVFAEDDLSISVDGAPVNLASATGASPAGGVFSGPGVSGGLFDPKTQVPGIYTLTYTVTDAFGVTNSANFTVTVEALPPALTLTKPKRFKTTLVGSSSRAQRVIVSNVGGLPTTTLRVVVSGPAKKDFVVTQPAVRSLEAGASTFFQVTFRPRKDGTRKAVVTVYSDSTPVSVKLQGRGQSKSGIRPPRAVKK
ncbi:MAG: cadherin-like domain-containing protein [Verrucomicrobiales bacterium]|nr:cadherin-like domain-containing protein [Verrucomicrobiales bacterium]